MKIIVSSVLAASITFLSGAAMAEGDPTKGKRVFNRCKTCHTMEAGKNRIGPHLEGIVGRKAAAVEGFKYSDAMAGSDISWTVENLDAYLASPKKFMPGGKMAFPGLRKEDQRADVIAFLQAQ